jgi:hypothetical protein
MLSKKQIKKNIEWLMANARAPVQYLTHRFLLNKKKDSLKVKKLWNTVLRDEEVVDIFAKQRSDGSWCAGGAWAQPPSYEPKGGCTPVSPKYVTGAWVLWLLGDMGFDIRDRRIKKACDCILSFQSRNGFISETRTGAYDVDITKLPYMPCRFSIMLIGLGKVGAGADPRTEKSYELLVRWQQDDGGWVLQKHREEHDWGRSCPWSTFHATYALHATKRKKYNKNVQKGLNFLLHHLSQKKPDDIRKFFYHGHSTVHELMMFSEHGIGMKTKPVKVIMDWLLSMYDKETGCFVYRSKPISHYSFRKDGMDSRVAKYRLHHLVETDWFTYYMTKIMLIIK